MCLSRDIIGSAVRIRWIVTACVFARVHQMPAAVDMSYLSCTEANSCHPCWFDNKLLRLTVIRMLWGICCVLTCQRQELIAQHVMSLALWRPATLQCNHSPNQPQCLSVRCFPVWGSGKRGDPRMEIHKRGTQEKKKKNMNPHGCAALQKNTVTLWGHAGDCRRWKWDWGGERRGTNKSAMKRRWRHRKELLKGFPALEGLPAPHSFSINTAFSEILTGNLPTTYSPIPKQKKKHVGVHLNLSTACCEPWTSTHVKSIQFDHFLREMSWMDISILIQFGLQTCFVFRLKKKTTLIAPNRGWARANEDKWKFKEAVLICVEVRGRSPLSENQQTAASALLS